MPTLPSKKYCALMVIPLAVFFIGSLVVWLGAQATPWVILLLLLFGGGLLELWRADYRVDGTTRILASRADPEQESDPAGDFYTLATYAERERVSQIEVQEPPELAEHQRP